MNPRKLRLGLRSAGAGFCLASVLMIVRSFLGPYTDPSMATASSSVQSETLADRQASLSPPSPSLQQFEALWQKPLRRPLVDPPSSKPVEKTAAVQRRSPPNVRLLGIALESGHSMAIFATKQGTIELKAIGDMLGDGPNSPQVSAIEDQQVLLQCQGETISVPLEDQKGR